MTEHSNMTEGQAGDWLEVNGLPGSIARRGQILEVLGQPGHIHYRVHWDEEHESLFYPSEGAAIVRPATARKPSGRRQQVPI
jgi:hypothetical protein